MRTVLVCCPDVPDPQRASGDVRLREMIRSLRRQGCAVTVLADRSLGMDAAAAALRADGVQVFAMDRPGVDVRGLLTADWTLVLLAFWHVAERLRPALRSLGSTAPVVVDTVDVHWRRLERQAELTGSARHRAEAADSRRRELAIYRLADVVLAVS